MQLVRHAGEREWCRFMGNAPYVAGKMWAGKLGHRIVFLGGVAQDGDGQLWGFLDLRRDAHKLRIFKWARLFLAELKDDGAQELRVVREADYATSKRFLTMLGFVPTHEMHESGEVWIWRV